MHGRSPAFQASWKRLQTSSIRSASDSANDWSPVGEGSESDGISTIAPQVGQASCVPATKLEPPLVAFQLWPCGQVNN
jgi:hypothetical protein